LIDNISFFILEFENGIFKIFLYSDKFFCSVLFVVLRSWATVFLTYEKKYRQYWD
jgi:hypothetical protein